MKVSIVAQTRFDAETAYDLTGWEPDTHEAVWGSMSGSQLSEFAGRSCYQSWDKPNQATATNDTYLKHIIDVGHLSVLEHASVTFFIEDVSRSLTHEFIRHRHLSPSQLSQRFVTLSSDTKPVIPPLYASVWETDPMEPHSETQGIVERIWAECGKAYDELVSLWEDKLLRQSGLSRMTTIMRKQAREAARCVLPNMTPTSIVMTGNHRSWRHFLEMRGSSHADAEIRQLALEMYRLLSVVEPSIYQDFYISTLSNGEDYLQVTRAEDR